MYLQKTVFAIMAPIFMFTAQSTHQGKMELLIYASVPSPLPKLNV
jgi:hypothetical protein